MNNKHDDLEAAYSDTCDIWNKWEKSKKDAAGEIIKEGGKPKDKIWRQTKDDWANKRNQEETKAYRTRRRSKGRWTVSNKW